MAARGMGMPGMGHGDRPSRGPQVGGGLAKKPKKPQSVRLRELWPDLREMILPRRGILAVGFVLMVVNRLCGLVLPLSTRYFVGNVIQQRQMELLTPLVLAVLGATLIQGVTSFALTQLLSKAAQRLIAELRQKVQKHIGALPVAYYDSNKSGVLVSRIMSDVEGVRNLLGTGLVDFVGGGFTATFALAYLLRLNVTMTVTATIGIGIFAVALKGAFRAIRPIYRA